MLLEEEISLIDTFSKQLTRDGSAIKQLVEFIHGRYSGPLFTQDRQKQLRKSEFDQPLS